MSTPTELKEPSNLPYNVFLSWSGERSKALASALRDWLPVVVQSARPWMSSSDIASGSRWRQDLGQQLGSITLGIACMTPENKYAHTVHFEAGAITRSTEESRLITFCLGMRAAELDWPLADFQGESSDEKGTRALLTVVNKVTGAHLDDKQMDLVFGRWWPVLSEKIEAIPAIKSEETPPTRPVAEMFAEIVERLRALDQHLHPRVSSKMTIDWDTYKELLANPGDSYRSLVSNAAEAIHKRSILAQAIESQRGGESAEQSEVKKKEGG